MATSRRWLLVAAEKREFDGILKRFGVFRNFKWDAKFSGETAWKDNCFVMIANGPGARLVEQALTERIDVDGVISTGFCGALDPSLKVGDVVSWTSSPDLRPPFITMDQVAVTANQKRALREKTCARVVDMESEAIARRAAKWGLPFYYIRAVTDTADEDLPLDFNLFRDEQGRFSRTRIALAAARRPFTVAPGLLRLDRNCKLAAQRLGDFFADCRL